MESKELYAQLLRDQYRVQRMEQMSYMVIFILAITVVPVAWILNHVYHWYTLGWMVDVIALCLGLAMAGHSHNALQVIASLAKKLNEMSGIESFHYDLGKANDPVRMVLTTPFKVIGAVLAIWALFKWPQL